MLLRYPGGKTKQAKRLVEFFSDCDSFVEPFVGGGSVFLARLKDNLFCSPIQSLLLNDLDERVYCFWQSICVRDYRKHLLELVRGVGVPSLDMFYEVKASTPGSIPEKAFKFLFLNRTSFSGLCVNPIGGKNQSSKWGVGCRWNGLSIVREITRLGSSMDGTSVAVSNLDFEGFLQSLSLRGRVGVYLDPPYVEAGGQLYPHAFSKEDHRRLFVSLANLPSNFNFLMSYDDQPMVRELVEEFGFASVDVGFKYTISGKKEKAKERNELLIMRREFKDEAQACF